MGTEGINATLRLSREDMQALGYRIVDMLVEHFETIQDRPVARTISIPSTAVSSNPWSRMDLRWSCRRL